MAQARAAGLALHEVMVKIDPHRAMLIAARQLLQNAISTIGQVLMARPDARSAAAAKQVEFVLASSHSEREIAAKVRIPTIAGEVSVTLIAAAEPREAEKPQETVSASPEPPTTELRRRIHLRCLSGKPRPSSQRRKLRYRRQHREYPTHVEAGRIDNVLNLVGELIIGKWMLCNKS